ncbi:hypothetical protein [Natronococcus occultus]
MHRRDRGYERRGEKRVAVDESGREGHPFDRSTRGVLVLSPASSVGDA